MNIIEKIEKIENILNNVKTDFEIYEDNSGGLYFCILDGNGCIAIFENFEYGKAGILVDALTELAANPTAYKSWDGDLIARLNDEYDIAIGDVYTAQDVYENGLGEFIAYNHGIFSAFMGTAGRKAFGLAQIVDNISIDQIKAWLEAGIIRYKADSFTVVFPDGAMIGGVAAHSTDALANTILRCLYREDFSTDLDMLNHIYEKENEK